MKQLAHPAQGMTLIELMVALLIGLGVTLAVTTLLIAGENHKRTTTSTNDAEQTGAYVIHALDGVLRGAGSSFAETAVPTDRGVLGCRLNAGAAGTLLPRAAAFPAPFSSVLAAPPGPGNLRVAPLVIAQNQSASAASDVIIVMGGSGAAGGVPREITNSTVVPQLSLDNTVGFYQFDLALVSQNGIPDCLLEEVASVATPFLNLGSTYYTVGTTTTLASLATSTTTYVTPLGNAAANNVQFEMFGVDANRTLWSYDLLQNQRLVGLTGTDTSQAIADGVVQMNAIYGIDTNADGVQDTWAAPGAPTDPLFDVITVMTTPATMRQIVSVRVALLVRGEYYDKNPVSPPTFTMFSGLVNGASVSLQKVINLSADDQHYRYRLFEFTVPLRNMLLLAGA